MFNVKNVRIDQCGISKTHRDRCNSMFSLSNKDVKNASSIILLITIILCITIILLIFISNQHYRLLVGLIGIGFALLLMICAYISEKYELKSWIKTK